MLYVIEFDHVSRTVVPMNCDFARKIASVKYRPNDSTNKCCAIQTGFVLWYGHIAIE